ncbi:MAG: lichenicidin A2 family type 2 lantibiotic [Lachnospiraceae bacterium]|nr:lichenicidin A2 family type 2 lantibiotic [Lachnospiraceae bacterium]
MEQKKNIEQEKINNVVGDSFEDLEMEEMTIVQGAGDIDAESTPALLSVSAALSTAAATYQFSKDVAKSIKNSSC